MLELVTAHAPELADSDARHGWGLFETLRVQEGRARWLGLHLARLAEGCAFLGLPAPPEPDAVEAFLAAHTELASTRRGSLRLLAVDGRLAVRLGPPPPPLSTLPRLALSREVIRASASPLNRFKTLAYLENRLLHREAEARGCFDCIAPNAHGRLSDGGRCTLLLRRGGTWWTPPVSEGALPGIARRVLLEAGLVREAPLEAAALDTAEGLLLVNALRGALPMADARGRAPSGHGAILRALA